MHEFQITQIMRLFHYSVITVHFRTHYNKKVSRYKCSTANITKDETNYVDRFGGCDNHCSHSARYVQCAMPLNADHCRSITINSFQFWSIGIDRNWSILIGIDRHWPLIQAVLILDSQKQYTLTTYGATTTSASHIIEFSVFAVQLCVTCFSCQAIERWQLWLAP